MRIVCLDLEGVLVPEIWIEFAERTGIPELRRTTRSHYILKRLTFFSSVYKFKVLLSYLNINGLVPVHLLRSEERRVGKECRSRWSPYH